jgi:hypothetical protein
LRKEQDLTNVKKNIHLIKSPASAKVKVEEEEEDMEMEDADEGLMEAN